MILEVKNINKSYGDKHILKDISFLAKSNNALGFLGRNGSGKTTTIRIIMNIINSDSGEILVDGVKLTPSKFKLGYLPEERGLYQKVTILEQMIYFGRLKGIKANVAKKTALNLLDRLGAGEYAKRNAGTLSKGNQQKVQLAIALMNDPEILILDEPFSGLDPVNSQILKDVIQENVKLSKIILFSSHQLESVEEFCEDVCLIDKGRIILSGNLEEIKHSYPKDKILIVPEYNNEDIIKDTLSNNLSIKSNILKYSYEKNGFIVTLKDSSDKTHILHTLSSKEVNASIRSFSVLEPSLLEIFLERVGATNE